MNDEKGQALPLVLLALAIGTLVIAPFLGHASSSLIGSRLYGQSIAELYSCDAGVEYAIWHLMNGETTVPEFTINNKTVNVTVEETADQIYRVVATATGADGSRSTIESYVRVSHIWSSDGQIGEDSEGDIYIDGDANIGGNVQVDGSVYATGNVTLDNNAEVTGNVIAEGKLELTNNAVIGGDVATGGDLTLNNNSEIGSIEVGGNICAGGNVYLDNNAIIHGSLYTGGNINMRGNATIRGDVYIEGNIASITLQNNARIEGNIYLTGNITSKLQLANNAFINKDVYATGTINNIVRENNILGNVYQNYTGPYPPHPECLVMPEPGGGTGIITWE